MSMFLKNSRKTAGFTLVEMLIALFIFSLISAGTMTALTGAISARGQVKQRLAEIGDVEVMRALIKSDMRHMILRENRDSFGAAEPLVLTGGYDDNLLTFTRSGRTNPGGLQKRGDVQRVSYIFEGGELIRRALPSENPAQIGEPIDRVLMRNLIDIDIEFIKNARTETFLAVKVADMALAADNPPVELIRLRAEFKSGDILDQYFEVGL